MKKNNSAQTDFFDSLKAASPLHQNFAQTVASCLHISTNEAYKKIKGSSALNMNQLVKLSEEFGIEFHTGQSNNQQVTFDFPANSEMHGYLTDLLNNLEQVTRSRYKHIFVTTDDIPIFHLFKYPELTAFKLQFWMESISDGRYKTNTTQFDEDILKITSKIHNIYLEIPSTEIWSNDAYNGTLRQIKYFYEAGYLPNKNLAIQIVEQVKYCLTDINMYSLGSKKSIDELHTFQWLNCDVMGSLTYLVDLKDRFICFNRFNTFNYLKTDNQNYGNTTKQWMNGLIRKSTAFSGQGEKLRNKYLYNAFMACDKLIQEINSDN